VVDTTILGKPRDHADAARMLRLLSGREHRVLTAVAVQRAAHMEVALSDSCVRFCTLNDDQINQYIVSGEANDKAGAYGIQGRAAQFIQHLSGSYSGVMGLPLFETTQLIQHVCADRATKEAVHE
jgi:septum formation protein